MGFKPETFDAIVCYSTFPHFHDKPLALRNMHDLLRKGGKVFICHTASRDHINNIHLNIPGFEDHLIPGYEEMVSLMIEAGFKQVNVDEGDDSYLAQGLKSV